MHEKDVRKIMSAVILIILLILAFFLLRPILLAIIMGIILAFIFNPIYKILQRTIDSKNISAFLICIIFTLIIIIPLWFLTPIAVEQSFKIYQTSQQIDLISPLKNLFPSLLASEEVANEIGAVVSTFVNRTTNAFMNTLSSFLLNLPTLSLQILVVFFTLFYILRDGDKFENYIKTLLPFSKEVEKKLFEQTKGITQSVIYGQVFIGIIQGLIAGIGFFIFGVPNALLLTLLAILAGIFPIIGTTVVWIPVLIYLLIAGNTLATFGVLIFGLMSSVADNLLRPIIVSKMTKIHSAILLVGMIGGLFLFGILGFILGPLILAYLLVIFELYRNKNSPFLFKETIR